MEYKFNLKYLFLTHSKIQRSYLNWEAEWNTELVKSWGKWTHLLGLGRNFWRTAPKIKIPHLTIWFTIYSSCALWNYPQCTFLKWFPKRMTNYYSMVLLIDTSHYTLASTKYYNFKKIFARLMQKISNYLFI